MCDILNNLSESVQYSFPCWLGLLDSLLYWFLNPCLFLLFIALLLVYYISFYIDIDYILSFLFTTIFYLPAPPLATPFFLLHEALLLTLFLDPLLYIYCNLPTRPFFIEKFTLKIFLSWAIIITSYI